MNKILSLLLGAVLLYFLSAADLLAQDTLVLEATYPGTSARGLYLPNDDTHMDFNGDGVPDMPLLQEEGISYFLKIIDGTSNTTGWTIPNIDAVLNGSLAHVVGFFELDGSSDTVEIVLAEKRRRRLVNPIVLAVSNWELKNPIITSIWGVWDDTDVVHLLTISNMDADVTCEVVVFNPQIPQVEVWGAAK